MEGSWEETILLCKSGNRVAQKRLFSELWPYLNGVGKRYIYNQSDIQDVLQEAFLNIFKYIQQYDASKSAFKTWATRIMINCCLKHNKKSKNQHNSTYEIKDFDFAVEPEVFASLNRQNLLKELKQMPSNYYSIFNMFIIDGFSHKEIAEALNIEEALSRQRLRRAKNWIKENFKVDDVLSKVILVLIINMI